MNRDTKDKLDQLSQDMLQAYLIERQAKINLDKIKEEIKKLAGSSDFTNEAINIKHYNTSKIDYKSFVEDSDVRVPDKYKTTSETVRITIVK